MNIIGPMRVTQRGAVLVFLAIGIALLIGVAALAVDLGRLFVLHTQMQNAVDAAALAAATELDQYDNSQDGGRGGARDRARRAARDLLSHQSALVKANPQLLQDLDVSATSPNFTFYCYIGEATTSLTESCDLATPVPAPGEPGKYLASSDHDAHYVRVTLNERKIDLFFLPVLRAWPINAAAPTEAARKTTALAGRRWYACNYPPLMICDPFENDAAGTGSRNLAEAVARGDLVRGDVVVLKYQANSWAPGDFAFLLPGVPGNYDTGAKSLGDSIANPSNQACTPPLVHTRTGSVQSWPNWALDTYFDIYKGYSAGDSKAAPNVINFPPRTLADYSDASAVNGAWKSYDAGRGRFANSAWDRDAYWATYHDPLGHSKPSTWKVGEQSVNWDSATRWEVYNWELAENKIPCTANPTNVDGTPYTDKGTPVTVDCSLPNPADAEKNPVWSKYQADVSASWVDGKPEPGRFINDPNRRVLYVAAIDCVSQNINGSKPAVASAFAKFFILQDSQDAASEKVNFIAEFMGLANENDDVIHHEVVLYE